MRIGGTALGMQDENPAAEKWQLQGVTHFHPDPTLVRHISCSHKTWTSMTLNQESFSSPQKTNLDLGKDSHLENFFGMTHCCRVFPWIVWLVTPPEQAGVGNQICARSFKRGVLVFAGHPQQVKGLEVNDEEEARRNKDSVATQTQKFGDWRDEAGWHKRCLASCSGLVHKVWKRCSRWRCQETWWKRS